MLKRVRKAGLVPAFVVSIVIAISLVAPASASRINLVVSGCGYGTPSAVAPTVTSVAPTSGTWQGGTSVTITGTDFCVVSAVKFGSNPSTSVTVNSRTSITAVSPVGVPGSTVDVRVTTDQGTSATSAADQFTYTGAVPPMNACSRQQYSLPGSDGATWMTIDGAKLSISVTPAAASYWVITGNADLWTSNLGINQDLGIAVTGGVSPAYPTTSGQPEAWKESGGNGGTFSPNAAAVQTVISVAAGQTYVATLQWKENNPNSGTIWAGAGPVAGQFSQSCILSQLIPVAPTTVVTAASTKQYPNPSSNGTTWTDMDAAALSLSITAPADGVILLTANSDLWTDTAGVNQDIAITVGSTLSAWKESGGAAGTFSPNAAFVQTVIPATATTTYTAKIQWKANNPNSGTIYAGAGPIGGKFSPTRLTAIYLPNAQKAIDKVSTLQYTLQNSNGQFWAGVDATRLALPFTPTANCTAVLSANVDLWTANGGINQDIGIAVVDGPGFPSVAGQPEGWKESGGGSGTFSPNAAYIQIVVSLTAGQPYSVQLVWKANNPNSGTIYAGAGPIGGAFSPTRLTLQPIGC